MPVFLAIPRPYSPGSDLTSRLLQYYPNMIIFPNKPIAYCYNAVYNMPSGFQSRSHTPDFLVLFETRDG
jgi:hypothetical protein